jgi:hypothetical protein
MIHLAPRRIEKPLRCASSSSLHRRDPNAPMRAGAGHRIGDSGRAGLSGRAGGRAGPDPVGAAGDPGGANLQNRAGTNTTTDESKSRAEQQNQQTQRGGLARSRIRRNRYKKKGLVSPSEMKFLGPWRRIRREREGEGGRGGAADRWRRRGRRDGGGGGGRRRGRTEEEEEEETCAREEKRRVRAAGGGRDGGTG